MGISLRTSSLSLLATIPLVSGCAVSIPRSLDHRKATVDSPSSVNLPTDAASQETSRPRYAPPNSDAVVESGLSQNVSLVSSTAVQVQQDEDVAKAVVFPTTQVEETLHSSVQQLEVIPASTLQATADGMTLEAFEALAYANNPSLKAIAATTQKAAGYRTQVGLKPNPTLGYQAQQLADQGTDQHLIFAEQELVTGGKLEWNRRVQNEAVRAQLLELEAQRWRVLTDIRSKYYQALALQQQLDLIREFQDVSNKGYELAVLRRQAAEGSQIDVLQSNIQKAEIDLSLRQTQVQLEGYWRELASIAGVPNLPVTRLTGELSSVSDSVNWETLASSLISESPEYAAAQVRITQASILLQRHRLQPLPNLGVQFGAGVDNGTNSGMMNVQVGAPIPVYNKNQGNISAAYAELCRAQMDAVRVEQSIKARIAVVSRDYDSALAAVTTYQTQILPSASESLELAEEAYRAGETSFLQVLIARRTYFDSNLRYISALSELAVAQAALDGYVLSGGLDPVIDASGDDSLRDFTFGQQ